MGQPPWAILLVVIQLGVMPPSHLNLFYSEDTSAVGISGKTGRMAPEPPLEVTTLEQMRLSDRPAPVGTAVFGEDDESEEEDEESDEDDSDWKYCLDASKSSTKLAGPSVTTTTDTASPPPASTEASTLPPAIPEQTTQECLHETAVGNEPATVPQGEKIASSALETADCGSPKERELVPSNATRDATETGFPIGNSVDDADEVPATLPQQSVTVQDTTLVPVDNLATQNATASELPVADPTTELDMLDMQPAPILDVGDVNEEIPQPVIQAATQPTNNPADREELGTYSPPDL